MLNGVTTSILAPFPAPEASLRSFHTREYVSALRTAESTSLHAVSDDDVSDDDCAVAAGDAEFGYVLKYALRR